MFVSWVSTGSYTRWIQLVESGVSMLIMLLHSHIPFRGSGLYPSGARGVSGGAGIRSRQRMSLD